MTEALRVTFEYEDGEVRVRSVRRIAMRVPPASKDRRATAEGQAVELRGAKGDVLYRRAAEVIPTTVEYPTGNADQPLGRVAAPKRGTASVLVPVDGRARTVAVVQARARREDAAAAAAAADLVTVDLEPDHYAEPEG